MDAILQFLIDWGYLGLFIGSFVAGSVIPFSSEAVLVACIGPLGLDPTICTLSATAGNVAGAIHINERSIWTFIKYYTEPMRPRFQATGNIDCNLIFMILLGQTFRT